MLASPEPPSQPTDAWLSLLQQGRDLTASLSLDDIAQALVAGALLASGAERAALVVQGEGSAEVLSPAQRTGGTVQPLAASPEPPGALLERAVVEGEGVLVHPGQRPWVALPFPGPDGRTATLVLDPGEAPATSEALTRIAVLVEQAEAAWSSIGNFQMLEEMVAQEMAAVVQREASIQLILDSMQSGLIVCDRDGTLSEICSAMATTWFGPPGDATVWDYLFPDDPRAAATFQLGYEQLIDDLMPFEVSADQMPRRFQRGERWFGLSFDPVHKDGALVEVVVSVSDQTAAVIAEEGEAASRMLVAAVRHLMKDASAFRAALADLEHLLDALDDAPLIEARRHLHTLKGNSAVFGLERFSRDCHHAEVVLEEFPDQIAQIAQDLRRAWASTRALLAPLISEDHGIQVARQSLDDVISRMVNGNYGEVLQIVRTWTRPSMNAVFQQLTSGLPAVAEQLGKCLEVKLEHHHLHVPTETAESFLLSLSHVVRNALVHGLETVDERVLQGKPEAGTLRLSCWQDADVFGIRIADDGRGIDWEAIARRAERLGLPHGTHEELVEALFADGVSTQEEVDTLAGRGVGMSAVRALLGKLGGSFELHSGAGVGTSWTFTFEIS